MVRVNDILKLKLQKDLGNSYCFVICGVPLKSSESWILIKLGDERTVYTSQTFLSSGSFFTRLNGARQFTCVAFNTRKKKKKRVWDREKWINGKSWRNGIKKIRRKNKNEIIYIRETKRRGIKKKVLYRKRGEKWKYENELWQTKASGNKEKKHRKWDKINWKRK